MLESMVRLSEAHAKMHLRNYVNSKDVDTAISVVLKSFLNCQKYYVKRKLEKQFRKYLNPDQYHLLYTLLQDMMYEKIRYYNNNEIEMPDEIPLSKVEFESKCHEIGIDDLDGFYGQIINKNFRVDESSIIKAI
eukprot:NODE_180_length_13923_cov_0.697772.p8 type:complete len:134 gc:universal NODE_180_length_13923_cov_0.697772:13163-13564(+)